MRAEELMIGDWVYMFDQNGTYPIKIEGISEFALLFDKCSYELIPLTSEILEKNDFKKDENEDGIFYCLIKPDFRVNVHFGFGWIYVNTEKQNYAGEGSYVHQLQHAMRLCGLNNLADDFKV